MEQNKKHYLRRLSALKIERESWVDHWEEISKVLLPRSGRFVTSDRNKGDKRNKDIIDGEATFAVRVLAAGLMSGVTSPSRPWFKLRIPNEDLNQSSEVKLWLSKVTELMKAIFHKSNTYRSLHKMYEELGVYGTAASIVVDDADDVIRLHTLTIGEYYLAQNGRREIDSLYREFQMTVGQMVMQFGLKACSAVVQREHSKGNIDQWMDVIHAIEPRIDRDTDKIDNLNMPFRSCYFEPSRSDGEVLEESGFKEFNCLTPRWDTTGGDIYGRSPGMDVLGDVKQLQYEQKMKGKAIGYKADPPLQVPMSMSGEEDLLPGGVSYYSDISGTSSGVRSAFEVNLDLSHLSLDIQEVKQRINKGFYADLFLMISQMDTTRTATEISARQEEKMLMLGTVLERLHNEMLDPLINLTFNKALDAGMLPPPPPELQGMDLEVEYVSVLAQAQKSVGTASIDRLLGLVGQVAQFKPEVLDKINSDAIVNQYADMLGTDPQLVVPDKQVAELRAQRAQAQQQAQQQAMVPQQAQTAKVMSETSLDNDSALSALVDNL